MSSDRSPRPTSVGPLNSTPTDEELMLAVAAGRHDALGPLYSRYASAIFHMALHDLGRAAAEELVQDVFLAVWRSADTFDPNQGSFRPWLFQLAHWKILNEHRRRRRRPVEQHGADDAEDVLEHVPEREPGPEERAWQNEQSQIVQSALEALPSKQRQAVVMAFLDDMTHQQVAHALDVPLGTAKTRVRSGLQIMRMHLAPVAASLLGLAFVLVGWQSIQIQTAYERDQRALRLVTTSELVPLRLTPASTVVPAGAHANYRGRTGSNVAVLTTEALPGLPTDRTYQAWVRHGEQWTPLGTIVPNADGNSMLVDETPELATSPDEVVISIESAGANAAPAGPVVLRWSP